MVARVPLDLPVWTMLPFVGFLLAIALLPLVAERFWHNNARKLLVAVGFSVPVIAYLAYLEMTGEKGLEALEHGLLEYMDFIVLLAALYIVAGGILVHVNVRPTPAANSTILAIGACLANWIGTTGASMVLIRPMLRINQTRQHVHHIPIFFIFLVANLGGLLTPLGDPPLFLGFLRGVRFAWTLSLWPQWLVANGLVLAVFFVWDSLAYRREMTPADAPLPAGGDRTGVSVRGLINLGFLAGVVLVVLLQSPGVSQLVSTLLGRWFPGAELTMHRPWGAVLMTLLALGSLATTPAGVRQANGFTWDAIVEVAVLFAGIFITMVPALDLMAHHSREFNLSEQWQYFWLTGALSSVLDNAPTYLTLATIAAGGEDIGALMHTAPELLQAISCGAVFMGAMTYIGNGPNFMVKTIAQGSGFRTPSFFGYVAYSAAVLLPVFLVITVAFFRT